MKPVVLQLIDSFHQGGSERQAIQLTRLLHESGRFNVRLACLNPEGSLRGQAEQLELGAIPSFPLTSFYDRNAIKQFRELRAFLRRERVSVLQTHDFYTNMFGMVAGYFARVPVRIASMRETAGMRTRAQKTAQRFAYGLAHHVVVNSEAVRATLEQRTSSDKISVVYNGLDAGRLAVVAPRKELLNLVGLRTDGDLSSRQIVSIVANMHHDVKDHPMFLRAARLIREAVPRAAFLLAGEGELTEEFRALAKELQIESDTFFLGRCENVGALLQLSDVCVLSSKAEGFSNAILEYMAAGRPVVATDVGGAREAIIDGQSGYLVNSGDYKSMAQRITELLMNSEKARAFGVRGRQVIAEKFSCEAQLKQTEKLYEKLLSRRRSSPEVSTS